jgi:hypothetical protein
VFRPFMSLMRLASLSGQVGVDQPDFKGSSI